MLPPDIQLALALALERRSYAALNPAQLAIATPKTTDRNLLVSAHTGTGKTVAYGLPLGDDLFRRAASLPFADAPLALVIAPTGKPRAAL